ncbi:hypothetical protein, partial [Falsiroseomonas sp. E2-1-a4]|uniref:hypothetical protein n=1 Tax=Falsiroseomonas sp. E2-1-a4 TaxID=3239299 RepID=UPI003F3CC69D
KMEAAKDDADGAELLFRLRLVDLPPDPDGDPRTTCIAEEAEGGAKRRKPLPATAKAALSALSNIILLSGEPIPPGELMPLKAKGVREGMWRAECEARRLSMAESDKDRERVFRRAAADLRSAGEIAMRDGWVWLLRTGDDQSNGVRPCGWTGWAI